MVADADRGELETTRCEMGRMGTRRDEARRDGASGLGSGWSQVLAHGVGAAVCGSTADSGRAGGEVLAKERHEYRDGYSGEGNEWMKET